MTERKNFLGQISRLSIDRYRIVYLFMAVMIVLGLYFYLILPRESKPEVVFPKIKVNVNYAGASPEDVESLITNKLEAALSQVEDVEFLTSSSMAGRSEIQLDFFPEADIEEKINEVNQAVLSVNDLPEEADPPSVKVSTTANRAFMVISLSGDMSPADLKDAADSISEKLISVKGINDIKVSGLQSSEISIVVDPARLAEFNLTVDTLVQTLRLRHKDTPAGDAVLDGTHYFVRVLASYSRIDEISRTLIPLSGGGTVFLKDVAQVNQTYVPRTDYSRRAVKLGTEEASMMSAVTLSLYRDGGTDIIGPSDSVKAFLNDREANGLPDELDVLIIQDDALSVKEDLAEVLGNAGSGLIIVVLVLFLFLGLKEAIITSLIIPFSLFLSFIALNQSGMTFNTMTLLAMIIALGLLVDNAIVVVESIAEFRLKGLSRKQAAIAGTSEVAPSILAATLTTMAAFFPLAYMEGRIGLIISVIPLTIVFIIGASLIVALTVTPMLGSRLLSKKTGKKEPRPFSLVREVIEAVIVIILFMFSFFVDGRPGVLSFVMASVMTLIFVIRIYSRSKKLDVFARAAETYRKILIRLLSRKRNRVLLPLIMFLLLGAVLSTIPLGLLRIELFPVMDESSLYVTLSTPQYSTLDDTDAVTRQIESKLLSLDGVDAIYSEVGVDSMREAEIVLNLKGPGERTWTTKEMIPQLLKDIASIPGVKATIGTSAGGKTANSPVQIKLIGRDMDSLDEASVKVSNALKEVEGIANAYSDLEPGFPEVQILLKPLAAADLGIDATTLGNAVKTAVSGQVSGTLITSETDLPIKFSTREDKIDSMEDLDKILLTLKDGTRLPLTHIASIVETNGLGTIRHSGGDRTVTVFAQMLPDANIREIVDQFDVKISSVDLGAGIHYEWAGDAADLDASFSEMTVNLVLALLVVFLILAVQFNSLSQPLVILLSVPMAVIGVFAGLLATGNNFGLYAFMGVIALVGIAVNDAIVLVDTINRNRGDGMPLTEAINDAGKSRFGPVLATTITTIGGILPLAFRDENYAQLSLSLIFGLMTSTVLTLIVLPIFYYHAETIKTSFKKRFPVFVDEEENNE
ncbi:efflux RND transporter permease subunit [Spirochaeta isovalerica]|uniref:HAE1 family hydrophobic/amphiphilic exporter-1 n=1 Tax=Spirochaeta isovalerica TaxID=150 RepID=A0A841RFE9_9SPIO|nr:efflux RND transporter permease subunit [Spirochaeta isovalerica]MBB6481308.1 HAE1 family hydrophobic/amphiphilic exporter-1 [Spirochaeta isovalerica]